MLNHGKQKSSQLYHCRFLLTNQKDLCLMCIGHGFIQHWRFCTLEQLKIICNVLTTCKLVLNVLVVQLFNHYPTAVMWQLLDLSAVSLMGREKGTCKISVQNSVELMILVAGLAVFIPGILQTIYILLTHAISGHLIDSDAVGRFLLLISGILFLQSYY